ncbi:MAG: hypothetical protein OEV88_08180 [Gammaproteobacteria bacterium]|nr:hypothetical protein [Gammaproteobacteria bacterium]
MSGLLLWHPCQSLGSNALSELIDDAVRLLMLEDQEDLASIADRVSEPVMTYEALLGDLKKHGKI